MQLIMCPEKSAQFATNNNLLFDFTWKIYYKQTDNFSAINFMKMRKIHIPYKDQIND